MGNLTFGKIENPFVKKKKPFVFGETEVIPELPEEQARRNELRANIRAIMQEPEAQGGYPTVPEPTPFQGERQVYEIPEPSQEVQEPTLPAYAPKTLKEALVHGLMGFIPGFQKGFYDYEEKLREEKKLQNDRKLDLYKEAVDIALEQNQQAAVQWLQEATVHNQLEQRRYDAIREQARIQNYMDTHLRISNQKYYDINSKMRAIFELRETIPQFRDLPEDVWHSIMIEQVGAGATAEFVGRRPMVNFIEQTILGRKATDQETWAILNGTFEIPGTTASGGKVTLDERAQAELYAAGGNAQKAIEMFPGGAFHYQTTGKSFGKVTGTYKDRLYQSFLTDPSPRYQALRARIGTSQVAFDQWYERSKITAATKTLGEVSTILRPKIDRAIKILQNPDYAKYFGPIAGRWNEFMAGTIGAPTQEFAYLRSILNLTKTGVMRAHMGARGSSQMLEYFENVINAKSMTAPALIGSLLGVRDFLEGYEDFVFGDFGDDYTRDMIEQPKEMQQAIDDQMFIDFVEQARAELGADATEAKIEAKVKQYYEKIGLKYPE